MFTSSAARNGNKILNLCPSSVSLFIISLCKNTGNLYVCPQITTIGPKRNLCSAWRHYDVDFQNNYADRTSINEKKYIRPASKRSANTRHQIDENLETIDIETKRKHITNETGDGTQSTQKHLYLSKLNHEHHPSLCSTLQNSRFTVYYNNNTKTPCWVYEYLTPENIGRSNTSRKNTKFREDFNLRHETRATLKDYKRSGFDRGHMAAAGNYRKSQDALNETFLLSNILPQVGSGFNQSIWKHLEEGIRDIVLQSVCVHLYTGPLFIPRRDQDGSECVKFQVIGPNRVAVPTHLFKIMLIVLQSYRPLNEYFSLSFMMPNQNICNSSHIEDFLVSIADVESVSGMHFFVSLQDNKINYQEILGRSSDENGFIDIFRARRRR